MLSQLMDYMIKMNTLMEYMKEEIDGEKTESEKLNKFLQILPKRGPTAFDDFLEALCESGQKFIADHLKEECRKKKDVEDNVPDITKDQPQKH